MTVVDVTNNVIMTVVPAAITPVIISAAAPVTGSPAKSGTTTCVIMFWKSCSG